MQQAPLLEKLDCFFLERHGIFVSQMPWPYLWTDAIQIMYLLFSKLVHPFQNPGISYLKITCWSTRILKRLSRVFGSNLLMNRTILKWLYQSLKGSRRDSRTTGGKISLSSKVPSQTRMQLFCFLILLRNIDHLVQKRRKVGYSKRTLRKYPSLSETLLETEGYHKIY